MGVTVFAAGYSSSQKDDVVLRVLYDGAADAPVGLVVQVRNTSDSSIEVWPVILMEDEAVSPATGPATRAAEPVFLYRDKHSGQSRAALKFEQTGALLVRLSLDDWHRGRLDGDWVARSRDVTPRRLEPGQSLYIEAELYGEVSGHKEPSIVAQIMDARGLVKGRSAPLQLK
jgi:hypothetical protein